jgi:hypothetical protein
MKGWADTQIRTYNLRIWEMLTEGRTEEKEKKECQN